MSREVPAWEQAIRDAADRAFEANPGPVPGPETAAWLHRLFYAGRTTASTASTESADSAA